MTAPERFADSQIPLAPRAPSIHDPSATLSSLSGPHPRNVQRVKNRRAVPDLLLRIGSVEPVLEDRGDRAVASRADVIAAPASGFEPVGAIFLGEPQDAEAGAESLLGVRLRAHARFERRDRCRTDLLRLSPEARRRPFGITPMRAWHVATSPLSTANALGRIQSWLHRSSSLMN